MAEHPAHRGHEFGGAYARLAALQAGDPDWMNATGGKPERPLLSRILGWILVFSLSLFILGILGLFVVCIFRV